MKNIIVIVDEAYRTQYGVKAKTIDDKNEKGDVVGKKKCMVLQNTCGTLYLMLLISVLQVHLFIKHGCKYPCGIW
jgi:hypothetical protein